MLESVFGKGTRTHIVEIVSEHQPIRIKKIYVKVNKLDSLSYQAVHKVVKQLESEHVLLKKANEYEIAKMTRMHPFVIKKSLAQLRNFSFPRLEKIYRKLGAMDLMIKIGKMDIRLALDKFVAEL